MARRHYHVQAGMHGDMPDYDTAHTSRRAAEAAAARYVRGSRYAYADCQVLGSAKRGRYDIYRRAGRSWEPWQYIEIVDCYEDGELWIEKHSPRR